MNDLENILPFLVLGLIFVGTNPSLSWARTLFRVFTAGRFLHTFVYAIFVIPQPGSIFYQIKLAICTVHYLFLPLIFSSRVVMGRCDGSKFILGL